MAAPPIAADACTAGKAMPAVKTMVAIATAAVLPICHAPRFRRQTNERAGRSVGGLMLVDALPPCSDRSTPRQGTILGICRRDEPSPPPLVSAPGCRLQRRGRAGLRGRGRVGSHPRRRSSRSGRPRVLRACGRRFCADAAARHALTKALGPDQPRSTTPQRNVAPGDMLALSRYGRRHEQLDLTQALRHGRHPREGQRHQSRPIWR